MRAADFFAFARARHTITLRRAAGEPEPWTTDPILGTCRFTNVFRELDRTTVWFREHVRNELARMSPLHQVLGTILFRTFNRVETGQYLFGLHSPDTSDDCDGSQCVDCQDDPGCHLALRPGWDYVLRDETPVSWLESEMRRDLPAPWVTGAYIVKTPDGMDKLRGALWIVEEARRRLPATLAALGPAPTLQALHSALQSYPYIGGFTGYEIVTDLRHLPILSSATDIMDWAHAGPGAKRGINRLMGRDKDTALSQGEALKVMRELLLQAGNDDELWPVGWPMWEMREVEHTLCEFDKYERVRLGEGRPRGKFR